MHSIPMKISSPIIMAYPGPPRRAGGLVRWLLLAVGLMGVLLYIRSTSLNVVLNSAHEPVDVTPAHLPTIPPQASPPANPFTTGRPTAPIGDAQKPPEEHKAPLEEHKAPVEEHKTPVEEEHKAPVDEQKAPAEEHKESVEEHKAPTEEHKESAEEHKAPAEEHKEPVEEHKAHVEEHKSPAEEEHKSHPEEHKPPAEEEHKAPAEEHKEHNQEEHKPVEEQKPTTDQKPEHERPAADAKVEEHTTDAQKSEHPIDTLIAEADKIHGDLLKKESKDINAAAAEYRRKRGRHPPPGFDSWFKFAQDNGAVMVEEFWDQIYHDLGPFWGLPPATMRKEAWDFEMAINIRNHNASAISSWFWTQIWLNMTQTIEHLLPDMDIALNAMDEPRIVLPWEKVDKYMDIERSTRMMAPPEEVVSDFRKLSDRPDPEVKARPKNWAENRPFWKLASRGCHPDSPARQAEFMTDFNHAASISLANTIPHTYKGFVSNFTLATDFCHQPDLQALHGMMIEPLSVKTTDILFPMFGGSKLPTNNEILLPAPMYWNNEERFSGGDNHGSSWVDKQDKVIWRGVATGGRNKPTNWKGFQRHRFVAMTNATKVSGAEHWTEMAENWALPGSQYDLAAREEDRLGEWTGKWADTGFVDLMCEIPEPNGTCNYTDPYYKVTPGMKMADQFNRKYLPDIDGNSFSGRYRGFLMSTSLPIKATIFREWHDSRLIPWKHFVPMDNRFMDFWGIMQYFLGYEGKNIKIAGHDREAEKIAMDGQAWANKVLRKEDMQIYVLRLLLEYARISDDRRDKMGWVGDLQPH